MRSRRFTLHKEVPFLRKKRRATPLPFLVLTPLLDRTFAIGHCGLTCVVCCCFLVRAIRPSRTTSPYLPICGGRLPRADSRYRR
jgi:hypothetical protein